MTPTGWFMVGWGDEFTSGSPAPLRYFGQELVGYRTVGGDLVVLDAHCPHLGAHLGYGGTVVDDCLQCPYHGWEWGPDGTNRRIPYEDRPNASKRLRSWPVCERHECVFLWHDPNGGPPRWEVPDVFGVFAGLEGSPDDYYRAYPRASVKYAAEPVHPQQTIENGVDSMHFRYVHGAAADPVLLDWGAEEHQFRSSVGFRSPKSNDVVLTIRALIDGVGCTFNVWEGRYAYRLVFCTTPVDESTSDLFYSIWWPRQPGDDGEQVPEEVQRRIETEFLSTLPDDLRIWRHQIYVEHPALAQQDARPYGELRRWSQRFYEAAATDA
jgi:3-ketosteroid 9alpha-monooxygenase subunit A